MIDISSIASQVKHNCNISDAKFWGFYSPCGLLLRMRDLYHLESRMKPWQKIDEKGIRIWIDEREKLWDDLESMNYQNIRINKLEFDPFDIKGINSVLNRKRYLYCAGYGNSMKPVFLLARLSESRKIKNFTVNIAGEEIARDLSAMPAMILGNTITTRIETAGLLLWHKFEEMKAMKCPGLLHRAFGYYGLKHDSESRLLPATIHKRLLKITYDEINTYIHHEIGEATQRRFLGKWWKDVLTKLPRSKAELFARAIKDVLADTCRSGSLAHIIQSKNRGSLYFFIAFFSGYRYLILPELAAAYEQFQDSADWDIIEKVRLLGYNRAKSLVKRLRYIYDSGNISAKAIEDKLITQVI